MGIHIHVKNLLVRLMMILDDVKPAKKFMLVLFEVEISQSECPLLGGWVYRD